MSKSQPDKIIDPLELIDTYGADALRFFLVTAGSPGNDIKMDAHKVEGKWRSERIEGARNFANKLWNATRFVLGKLSDTDDNPSPSLADRWIIARLRGAIQDVRRLMDGYEYGEAGRLIYDFIWSDFCDWYLEFAKVRLNKAVLLRTIEASLRLLHPFMPFVTEALWQKLKEAAADRWSINSFQYPALMLAPYPRADAFELSADEDELKGMALVQQAIHAIRNARAEYGVEPGKRIMAHISAGRYLDAFLAMRAGMELLARIAPEAEITAQTTYEGPAVTLALGEVVVYLPLAGLVDLEAERRRLSESLADLEAQIARSEQLLASDFSRRAPPEVVEKEREKLDTLKLKRDQVSERLKAL